MKVDQKLMRSSATQSSSSASCFSAKDLSCAAYALRFFAALKYILFSGVATRSGRIVSARRRTTAFEPQRVSTALRHQHGALQPLLDVAERLGVVHRAARHLGDVLDEFEERRGLVRVRERALLDARDLW